MNQVNSYSLADDWAKATDAERINYVMRSCVPIANAGLGLPSESAICDQITKRLAGGSSEDVGRAFAAAIGELCSEQKAKPH